MRDVTPLALVKKGLKALQERCSAASVITVTPLALVKKGLKEKLSIGMVPKKA